MHVALWLKFGCRLSHQKEPPTKKFCQCPKRWVLNPDENPVSEQWPRPWSLSISFLHLVGNFLQTYKFSFFHTRVAVWALPEEVAINTEGVDCIVHSCLLCVVPYPTHRCCLVLLAVQFGERFNPSVQLASLHKTTDPDQDSNCLNVSVVVSGVSVSSVYPPPHCGHSAIIAT